MCLVKGHASPNQSYSDQASNNSEILSMIYVGLSRIKGSRA